MRSERDLKPLSFPKCFYASVEDSLIILENMKEIGFEVVEKKIECKFAKKTFYLVGISVNYIKDLTNKRM